jgi:hypothetical protein
MATGGIKGVTMGAVGPLSKRAVAGIALAFGLVTVLVVILASNGGNDDSGNRIEKAQKDAAEQFRKSLNGGEGAQTSTGAKGDTPSGARGETGPGTGSDTGTGGSGAGPGSQDGSGQQGSGGTRGSDDSPSSQGGQQGSSPELVDLAFKDNKAVGGFKRLVFTRDDQVRLKVGSDVDDVVRIDGYNYSDTVSPGKNAKFDFTAKLNGTFEIGLQKRGVPLAYLIVKGDVGR